MNRRNRWINNGTRQTIKIHLLALGFRSRILTPIRTRILAATKKNSTFFVRHDSKRMLKYRGRNLNLRRHMPENESNINSEV
jgi:hypothetical protein